MIAARLSSEMTPLAYLSNGEVTVSTWSTFSSASTPASIAVYVGVPDALALGHDDDHLGGGAAGLREGPVQRVQRGLRLGARQREVLVELAADPARHRRVSTSTASQTSSTRTRCRYAGAAEPVQIGGHGWDRLDDVASDDDMALDTDSVSDTVLYPPTPKTTKAEHVDTRRRHRGSHHRPPGPDPPAADGGRPAVFAEHGVEGASVEEICEAAGFTRGAFYSNFADKSALVLAMIQQRIAAQFAAAERAIDTMKAAGDREPDELVAIALSALSGSGAARGTVGDGGDHRPRAAALRCPRPRAPRAVPAFRRRLLRAGGRPDQRRADPRRAGAHRAVRAAIELLMATHNHLQTLRLFDSERADPQLLSTLAGGHHAPHQRRAVRSRGRPSNHGR